MLIFTVKLQIFEDKNTYSDKNNTINKLKLLKIVRIFFSIFDNSSISNNKHATIKIFYFMNK